MTAWCTPRHMVSYRGGFYEAEEPFEIDPADAEEMARYGKIELEEDGPQAFEEAPPSEEFKEPDEPNDHAAELPKRRRRS